MPLRSFALPFSTLASTTPRPFAGVRLGKPLNGLDGLFGNAGSSINHHCIPL